MCDGQADSDELLLAWFSLKATTGCFWLLASSVFLGNLLMLRAIRLDKSVLLMALGYTGSSDGFVLQTSHSRCTVHHPEHLIGDVPHSGCIGKGDS